VADFQLINWTESTESILRLPKYRSLWGNLGQETKQPFLCMISRWQSQHYCQHSTCAWIL